VTSKLPTPKEMGIEGQQEVPSTPNDPANVVKDGSALA